MEVGGPGVYIRPFANPPPPAQPEGSDCVPTQSQEAAWPLESRLVVRKRSASLWARVQRRATQHGAGPLVRSHQHHISPGEEG